jgi:hypothetical protein
VASGRCPHYGEAMVLIYVLILEPAATVESASLGRNPDFPE